MEQWARYPMRFPVSPMSTSKKGFDPLASLFDLPDAPVRVAPVSLPAKGEALPEPPHVKPAPASVPALPAPDPVQLAKMLARAAQARAGAPTSAPGGRTLVLERVLPPAAAPPAQSRLMAAPLPRKSVSAADAMRLAGESEARAKAEAAAFRPAPPQAAPLPQTDAVVVSVVGEMSEVVAGIIQDTLPELGKVYVAKALIMEDRGLLTALWRAHRSRFASAGDVAGAVAVSAVLRALAATRPGQLAAAHAVTDKSDWLIWVDLGTSTPIAAFKDARAWFGGS